mgnify:CR=1 FL=1
MTPSRTARDSQREEVLQQQQAAYETAETALLHRLAVEPSRRKQTFAELAELSKQFGHYTKAIDWLAELLKAETEAEAQAAVALGMGGLSEMIEDYEIGRAHV